MKKLLIALGLIASFSAMAEWKAVGFIDGKPSIGVDPERFFVSPSGTANVWWKVYHDDLTVVSRPTYHPMDIYRSKIDCRNRMIQNDYSLSVEAKSFYDNNPSQYQSAWNGPGIWYVPDINSAAEFVVNYYCKK